MHLSALSSRQLAVLLPFLLSLPLKASSSPAIPTPTADWAPPPIAAPPPAPPPYTRGTCTMHINEYEIGCASEDANLHAEITIKDAAGKQIGYTMPANGDASNVTNFPSIDAGNSLNMMSDLGITLQVTGEHANDYIQFTLLSDPQHSWTSRTEQSDNPDYYCENHGWSPKDGSACFFHIPLNAKNQIDCSFKC